MVNHSTARRSTRGPLGRSLGTHVLAGLMIAFLVAGFVVMLGSVKASGQTVNRQPYGSCWEAYRYVKSPGAQDCRHEGWRVKRHLVVNPRGVAWTDLKPCRVEDGARCHWDAGTSGNGRGHSFVNLGSTDHGTVIYVRRFR